MQVFVFVVGSVSAHVSVLTLVLVLLFVLARVWLLDGLGARVGDFVAAFVCDCTGLRVCDGVYYSGWACFCVGACVGVCFGVGSSVCDCVATCVATCICDCFGVCVDV